MAALDKGAAMRRKIATKAKGEAYHERQQKDISK